MHRNLKIIVLILLGVFAAIGLLFTAVFIAMQFHVLNVPGSIEERNRFFFGGNGTTTADVPVIPPQPCIDTAKDECAWNETPEWVVVAGGLTKDASVIKRVSAETGIDARLIAATVIPEQLRFFTSEREVFKRYFEPLKILGSLSQFSLGVSGIKQETALQIEQYANDPASPFYPGEAAARLLKYPEGTDHDPALYARLTDAKDHYYSYLYTALYLKEVMAQWKDAGHDISDKPEILITLFNIGFQNSHPNPNPQAAGASISVGGMRYPFGTLGGAFYRSDELVDTFPR